jgi:hypothetical protein
LGAMGPSRRPGCLSSLESIYQTSKTVILSEVEAANPNWALSTPSKPPTLSSPHSRRFPRKPMTSKEI